MHHLMEMRRKARVLVPEGCVLMGTMDETAQLAEGCVFLQASRWFLELSFLQTIVLVDSLRAPTPPSKSPSGPCHHGPQHSAHDPCPQVLEPSGVWRVVRGRVLLAKHPVMHPGESEVSMGP